MIERLENDFKYALEKNNISETYFIDIFGEAFWQQNRPVLMRAFLEFSTLDSIESFGMHCRKCGIFNSDRHDGNYCVECGQYLYSIQYLDDE